MDNHYLKGLKGFFSQKISLQALTFFVALLPFVSFSQEWTNVGAATGVSAGGSSFQNLAKDASGNLYISYYDVSVLKGSVQKFDGTNWTYLGGSAGITSGTATYNALAVKDAQNIYYSNQDGYPNSGMNVRKFDGTSWTSLPNSESSTVTYQGLAVDASGIVYAASGIASGTVKRFVNGAWEQVGTAGFASGVPTYLNLKVGTNGKIYASFNNNGNVHVYQNDVTASSTQAWTAVGGVANIAAASASENYNSSLAIDGNNNLYLAYVSGSAGGNKLNVKKFNGTSWINLGTENFSAGRVQFTSIAVTNSGVSYVACSNWEDTNFLKNYVYAFNNETWVQLGGFISSGEARYNSLIVNNDNDLVLAFSDSQIGKTVVKKFEIITPVVNYCAINFPQGAEPITNVTFAGINNDSPSAINSSTLAYEDFSTISGEVRAGNSFPISVSGFNPANTINNFANHITVYFDWNQNGSFTDAGEAYYLGYIQGNAAISTITGNIAVPANAVSGNTRMRVIKKYYTTTNESIANPCNTTGYGQAEDYTIAVNGQAPVAVASVTVSVQNGDTPAISTLGGTLQLLSTVLPSNANQNVVWSITSGNTFATVSQSGLVTATANGSVVIRATSAESATIYGEITLTITNQTVPATCTFETLALTGFNADVIAEGTGGNTDAKTSAIIDAANVYYAQDFVPANPHSSGASATAFGGGLPVNGTISSTATQGLSYKIADYTASNALVLRNNLTNTGTLSLVSTKKAQKVYVASVSAEGTNTVTATVNFADNTTQVFTIQATDWWQTGSPSNKVISGIGRVSRGASWAPLNQFDGLSQTGIYQNELILADSNFEKLINSITFTQTPPSGNATTTAILAVSICETPTTVTYGPVAITSGFNHDIIANGVGNASQSTTIGFDEVNTRALVSLDFKAVSTSAAPSFGLPVNGTINSVATSGVTFQLANYTGPNALYLTPTHVGNGASNNGTLAFSASNVGKLYVLAGAAGGGSNSLAFNATINFADGTSQAINNVAISDWYSGSNFAIQGIGRVNTANNNLEGNSTNPRLYEIALNILEANQSKTITGVNFSFAGDASAEYASQIRMSVLAITTIEPASSQDVLTVATLNNTPATITSSSGILELVASLNAQAIYSGVTWTIEEGEALANIDIYGKVTAVSNGTVTVRATLTSNPTIFGEIEIIISGQPAGYCDAYFINGCSDLSITSVNTTGAVTNLTNTNSGCLGSNNLDGYSNHTNLTLSATRNSTVTFNVNFTGSLVQFAYLSAWVDWNQDMIFDDSERIFLSETEVVNGILQFTTTIPNTALLGNTRMRLKAVSGWAGSGACGYNSIGEVEDYTFNVQESLGTNDNLMTDYKIYPNPTSGFATIESSETVKEVSIYNMIGQQVSKGNSSEINLSNVETGIYLVQILFENGSTATQKLVKK